MREVHIRPASNRDAAAVARVLVRSIREVCGPDYDQDEETLAAWCSNKTPERVRAWVRDPELFTVVAEKAVETVGVAQLHADGEIRLCYLVPEALGQGIGAALIAALEEEARARALERITLTSTSTAREFYRRHGYRETGEPVAFGAGEAFPMAKTLRS